MLYCIMLYMSLGVVFFYLKFVFWTMCLLLQIKKYVYLNIWIITLNYCCMHFFNSFKTRVPYSLLNSGLNYACHLVSNCFLFLKFGLLMKFISLAHCSFAVHLKTPLNSSRMCASVGSKCFALSRTISFSYLHISIKC